MFSVEYHVYPPGWRGNSWQQALDVAKAHSREKMYAGIGVRVKLFGIFAWKIKAYMFKNGIFHKVL